eukprot:Blabericola_migrator_1__190@NODE_1050_length_5592_cov_103_667873_g722_i0_p1_GENE_NODE_1050_length_5592_cov_103_667873_g722_i0NODE_1050_length_5592_cov_103_667873_g722_i0_p1_ORF_typecomplete_len811_score145_41_NODE_1050_length_5592_cov_103_667873_g722_i03372769
MSVLTPSNINEYFLSNPIEEVRKTLRDLQRRADEDNPSAFMERGGSQSAMSSDIRDKEKELLNIMGRVCKTKQTIMDEANKMRDLSLRVISQLSQQEEVSLPPPPAEDKDYSLYLEQCRRHHDMVSALLIQESYCAEDGLSVASLRRQITNRDGIAKRCLDLLNWDLFPVASVLNCYLCLALMFPTTNTLVLLSAVFKKRLGVMERLLRECISSNSTEAQALKLALILNMSSSLESLLSTCERLPEMIEDFIQRTSRVVDIRRRPCSCVERTKMEFTAGHPTIIHGNSDDLSVTIYPLVFGDGYASLCLLDCLDIEDFQQAAGYKELVDLRQRVSEGTQELVSRLASQTPRNYDEIHSFYSWVMTLLSEWSADVSEPTPWYPLTDLTAALRQAIRYCPTHDKLAEVLATLQEEDLLSSLSHTSFSVPDTQAIQVLRSQCLISFLNFMATRTSEELTSDVMRSSKWDKIAHHIFVSFWHRLQMKIESYKASKSSLSPELISSPQVKVKLVDSLTTALRSLTSSNINVFYFHFLWVLIRHRSHDDVKDTLIQTYLAEFWEDSLTSHDLQSLQSETASIVERVFGELEVTASPSTPGWNVSNVLWMVEVLMKHVLPLWHQDWEISPSVPAPEKWFNLIRLGCLRRLLLVSSTLQNPQSCWALIHALYGVLLKEDPSILDESDLFFMSSLDFGRLLAAMTENVSPTMISEAQAFVESISALLQPFINRDLTMRMSKSTTHTPPPIATQSDPPFFKKLPIVRRIPLNQGDHPAQHISTTPSTQAPESSFSLSQLLTVRPTLSSTFGALWDNVRSK